MVRGIDGPRNTACRASQLLFARLPGYLTRAGRAARDDSGRGDYSYSYTTAGGAWCQAGEAGQYPQSKFSAAIRRIGAAASWPRTAAALISISITWNSACPRSLARRTSSPPGTPCCWWPARPWTAQRRRPAKAGFKCWSTIPMDSATLRQPSEFSPLAGCV